ncbi:MAG TPA: TIGR00730 family Rossman fold protein [Tepidisphaeraceae bacterium]|nr:TIGR00730 family Rossman fold protein [Tepidisphaeraceae bacterium]
MDNLDQAPTDVEQPQETSESPVSVSRSDMEAVREKEAALLQELQRLPDGGTVGEIIANALKLLRDQTNRGDIKLINKSFKEIRYALKIFSPYRDVRKVSIFGSARTAVSHSDYKQAADFARIMADAGWMVITGAGGGIMAAGHGGAGAKPSFGLAIRLPFEQATNEFIADDPKLINFKYFFTRKLMFVRSSHAVVLFPGGFGTMDEGFEVLTLVQTGKTVPTPIVFVDSPGGSFWSSWQDYIRKHLLDRRLISPSDLHLYKITDDITEAARELTHFYSNYHSLRFVGDEVSMRLQRKPTANQLEQINRDFGDICSAGGYRVGEALAPEQDEVSLVGLPRLIFQFNRRDHGRLRQLINFLNDLS